ncbi:MAG: glycosyltransferase family 39 protein [Candidatus Omnitrophica bacterium]|nr:glycosyltransferase family 39 protein [Candidatus Omnitrophota bacterium]
MSIGFLQKRPYLKHLIALALLILLAFSIHLPYRDLPLAIDSSIFAAVAMHLNHGKVLYQDAWDHKPPMVFFLNAAALALEGENHQSIRDLQTTFALFILLAFYSLLTLLFGSVLVSFLGTLLYLLLFYHPVLYGGGNFTEEYGAFFVLVGVWGIVLWSVRDNRRNPLWLLISGGGFGAAILTKEPFLLSSVPWFFYILCVSPNGWKRSLKNIGAFVCGGLLVALVPLAYLIWNHALGDWFDVIVYGFRYADRFASDPLSEKMVEGVFRVSELIFSHSLLASALFLFGVASLSRRSFLRRCHYLPLFALYWVILDFFAASISGLFFLHYYLQMVSPILFVGSFGLVFVTRFFRGSARWWRRAGMATLIVCGLADFAYPGILVHRPPLPEKVEEEPLVHYLKERMHPGDSLWVASGYLADCYLETGMLSPTRYLAVFKHHLELGASRRIDWSRVERIQDDLKESPPEFIVGSQILQRPLGDPKFVQWLEPRYTVSVAEGDTDFNLVFSRVSDASESLAEQKKEWASIEAHSPGSLPFYQSVVLRLLQDSAPQSF